jgi:hypothetical protein
MLQAAAGSKVRVTHPRHVRHSPVTLNMADRLMDTIVQDSANEHRHLVIMPMYGFMKRFTSAIYNGSYLLRALACILSLTATLKETLIKVPLRYKQNRDSLVLRPGLVSVVDNLLLARPVVFESKDPSAWSGREQLRRTGPALRSSSPQYADDGEKWRPQLLDCLQSFPFECRWAGNDHHEL